MKCVLSKARRAVAQRVKVQARVHQRDSLRGLAAEAERKRAGPRVAQQWESLKAPLAEAQDSRTGTWKLLESREV